MKAFCILLPSAFLFVSSLAIADLSEPEKLKLIAKRQSEVAQLLKDPDSAKFRNVYVSEIYSEPIVCGEVNGKNSYGAYAGYTTFMADGNTPKLKVNPSEYETFCGKAP